MSSYQARDRAGRFNGTLRSLVDARLVTPSRISEYATINPAMIEAGESIHIRWVRAHPHYACTVADLYVVGCLWWGDYTGDDVARSNHRSLLRDFPDTFVHLVDAFHAHGLALLPDCRNLTLAVALLRLVDYPLYDEDDHAHLIVELADEMWDAYLHLDILARLRDEHGIDLDGLNIGDDELRDLFLRIHGDRFGDEYAATATSVAFPSLEETVAEMAAQLHIRS
jgi:ribosomal protein S18 acetylase RimI-like enzyme